MKKINTTKCLVSLMLIPALMSCRSSNNSASANNSRTIPASESLFLSIVTPGSNGNTATSVGGPDPSIPQTRYPDNYRDQLDLYGNIAQAISPLKDAPCTPSASLAAHQVRSDQACNYFKSARIELPANEAVRTRTLTASNGKNVTIRRDAWGVPYIDGEDRAAAQYGLGFAAAQDRLWLFDLLRHVGRGRASEILGPAPTTFALVDAVVPFALMPLKDTPMTPQRFRELFNSMTATFNWAFVDKSNIAYFQSELYPLRAANIHPDLPQWGDGRFEWQRDANLPANFFTQFGGDGNNGGLPYPPRNTAVAQNNSGYFEWPGHLNLAAHVSDENPTIGYMAQWNNIPARGWWASDGNGALGPSHRVDSFKLKPMNNGVLSRIKNNKDGFGMPLISPLKRF